MSQSPGQSSPFKEVNLAALRVNLIGTRDEAQAFLRELVDIYLRCTPPLIAQLESFVGRTATLELARGAHELKSCSASLGLKSLAADCQEIEMHGETMPQERLMTLVRNVKNSYAAAEKELRTLRDCYDTYFGS